MDVKDSKSCSDPRVSVLPALQVVMGQVLPSPTAPLIEEVLPTLRFLGALARWDPGSQ